MKASVELNYGTTGKEEIIGFTKIERAMIFMNDEIEMAENDPQMGSWEFVFMGIDEDTAYFNGYYSL